MTRPEIASRDDVDAVYFNFAPISGARKRSRFYHRCLASESASDSARSPHDAAALTFPSNLA